MRYFQYVIVFNDGDTIDILYSSEIIYEDEEECELEAKKQVEKLNRKKVCDFTYYLRKITIKKRGRK